MPYTPINKCLSSTEDIRLQHRYSDMAKELSRTTNFNKKEIMRLLQFHYMFTVKRNRTMDRLCFAEFMDVFLGFRNIEAVEKIHQLRCEANKRHLTDREFVETMSLLLKGSLPDTIKFCFDVYTEMVRSPAYIKKEDVLVMARRNSLKMCKLANMEEYDQNFVEFVMNEVDKDRDNRISFEDYRTAVTENVTWLQFLGPILPTPEDIELFMLLFTPRPYVNNIELSPLVGRNFRSTLSRSNTVTATNANVNGANIDQLSESLFSTSTMTEEGATDNANAGPALPLNAVNKNRISATETITLF